MCTSSRDGSLPLAACRSCCAWRTVDPRCMMAPSCTSSLRVSTLVLPTLCRYHDTASEAVARLQQSGCTRFSSERLRSDIVM